MTAKCPSKKVTCQRVETMMLIGWIVKWNAKILAWNSPFRLEILYFVLSQISGSLPFNSSYLAFFGFLCADQLREWNEYLWYSGKCICETKKLSGCGSAHEPHLGYVQGREGGNLQSLCSSSPAVISCPSSASVPTSKILGLRWENEKWWWERGGKYILDLCTPDLFNFFVFCRHKVIYLYVELHVVSSIKGKQTEFYSTLDSLKRTTDLESDKSGL